MANNAILDGWCWLVLFLKMLIFIKSINISPWICEKLWLYHFDWLLLVSAISHNDQIYQKCKLFTSNAQKMTIYAIFACWCWLVLKLCQKFTRKDLIVLKSVSYHLFSGSIQNIAWAQAQYFLTWETKYIFRAFGVKESFSDNQQSF